MPSGWSQSSGLLGLQDRKLRVRRLHKLQSPLAEGGHELA